MKRLLILLLLAVTIAIVPGTVFAQKMMGTQSAVSSDGHTAREEQEGKEVWEKLQTKEVTCERLSDEDFGSLGEYFMGQMMGDSHEAMNNRLIQMMGKVGEEKMHVAMGKRMSGCDTDASPPQNMMGGDMMSMMMNMLAPYQSETFGSGMMGGGGNPMMGFSGNNMMGGWNGFGILGWLPMLLFWILLILGVVALVRYLGGSTRSSDKERSPVDILKERYAKGEIDKKEFERMKKDLS